ncbi:hypothetical protein Syun_030327 [Stephania yunnanensis]|uniref:Uncharacterized protein n=1 Tax=Stephania yunnanensis TaxID=152371 RepID=A0AAP0EAA5_9MAGN
MGAFTYKIHTNVGMKISTFINSNSLLSCLFSLLVLVVFNLCFSYFSSTKSS